MAAMDYMAQALSLARLAVGNVSPNPAVGAVVVREGEVVGQGYTQPPGMPHAEIVALQQAGELAKNAVLYVTLEPCCHYGRTPPCTKSIIAAGIREVHFAMVDPNPIINGKGRAELEQAGIITYAGEQEDMAKAVNESYVKYITTGIPFVTAKFAISLDGKIATRTGESRWISGEESRRYVHRLRREADAVMVGVGTVLADDPSLTTKTWGGRGGIPEQQPLRVVVDANGRTPPNAKLFRQPGQTLLAQGKLADKVRSAYIEAGAELLELSVKDGMVDLESLFCFLGKREVTSVLAEGGGIMLGSLFDLKLVDKVIAFIAPVIIGGREAKIAVAGEGVARMAEVTRLQRIKIERFGQDVMVSGYVR